MHARRLQVLVLVPAALLAALLLPSFATAATTIHVVERAATDAVTNGSTEEDKAGNVLTWHNKVYDAKNKRQVGTDAGYCIRTIVGKAWECSWTTYLHGGSIMVQGPFSDTGNTVLAVTGGTGAYAGADGTMNLRYHNKKGTAFDFIFHLR